MAGADSAPKLIPAIVTGILSSSGVRAKRVPSDDRRVAPLPVALERVAGDARTQEEQVVEVRHVPLGAEAPDVVDPLAGGPLDLGDDVAVEEVRLAQAGLPRPVARRSAAAVVRRAHQ